MKDLVISARAIRRELAAAGICLLLALLVNVGAIVAYRTHWIELLTTFHVTVLLALLLYGASALLRLLWAGVRRLVAPGPRRITPPAPPDRSTARGDRGGSAPAALAGGPPPEGARQADLEVPAGS